MIFVFPTAGPVTTPKAGDGECPIGWKKRADFCYFFELKKSATWLEAHYQCKRKHPTATLTTVEDMVEGKWLSDMTAEIKAENVGYYPSSAPWIGLYRSRIGTFETWRIEIQFLDNFSKLLSWRSCLSLVDNNFYWHGRNDTKLDYYDWTFGEPSARKEKRDCAWIEVERRGRWHTARCTQSRRYICKMAQCDFIISKLGFTYILLNCTASRIIQGFPCSYCMTNLPDCLEN